MDWSRFNLGVGPMSPQVVDSCLRYSHTHNYPMMIIASRNQVNHTSGYAFKTNELVEYIKSNKYYNSENIKICRDHCGPNFADEDKKLDFDTIVNNCKETIKHDIDNGFDLIHIDVGRTNVEKQEETATLLIEYALSLNPNISLEFGSEDNTGQNLHDTLLTLKKQVEFIKKYKKNIKFIVNQTGSLTKQTQVGIFNSDLSYKISNIIHENNFLFKEHNADYLTKSQVRERYYAGIDSVNIAPQLGYIHTSVINKLGYNYDYELKKFKEYVLDKEYWKKWVVDGVNDPEVKFCVSGHYFLNSEYARLIQDIIAIKKLPIDELLYQEISIALDQYRLGFGEKNV